MRELQLAWNLLTIILLIDWLRGELPTHLWPGFFITGAAALGMAILLEQPRRSLAEQFKRRIAVDDPYVE